MAILFQPKKGLIQIGKKKLILGQKQRMTKCQNVWREVAEKNKGGPLKVKLSFK